MNYYFEVENKEDAEKAKRMLEKRGFIVPDILSYHILYFAVGGQVYGIPNADSERYKPLADYIKNHSDITELVLDAEPLFKKGQILVNKQTGDKVVVFVFIEEQRTYICTKYIGCGALTFPVEDEAEWAYIGELPKYRAGQSIQKDGEVYDISVVDENHHHYLCKTHDKNKYDYIIPFRVQDEYTLAPIFSVGQRVRHKGCTNSYYVEITEVLACSYNVVDSDGVPNSFLIEKQDEWELVPKPLFKVGEPVVFNGGLYMVQKISKRVSRKEKRGEWVLTIADGVLVGENNVRRATKEEIDKFTGGQNYG